MCRCKCTSGNTILSVVVMVMILDIIGLALPYWYHQTNYNHNVNVAMTTSPVTMTTLNVTFLQLSDDITYCQVTMEIHEGLWNRYCYDSTETQCVSDVQEICDSLDYPEFNDFVLVSQICGDVILLCVVISMVRSKVLGTAINREMIGAKIGFGGLLQILGAIVYAAEDSGEIGYQTTDLHAGWGLCLTSGTISCITCLYTMYTHIHSSHRDKHRHFFPINDESSRFGSDVDMLPV